MLEFTKAVEAKVREEADPDEDVVEVNLWGLKVQARRMTTTQAALLMGSGARPMSEQTAAILGTIEAMMGIRARRHVQELIFAGQIEMSDLLGGNDRTEMGVIDAVIEEFTGR